MPAPFQHAAWTEIPLSDFGQKVRASQDRRHTTELQSLWSEFETVDTSAHACFLRPCLDLGQVLWQEQCHQWTKQKKAWVAEEKVLRCIRWYLQGERVGDAPVFHGVCASCGQLFYGHANKATGTSGNKHFGTPCNVKGQGCSARSQPPFLLRWPPRQLPEFLPDVFAWAEASNRLSLREQHRSSPQARAGKVKNFFLEKLSLWCYLSGHTMRAAAPIGIAAARLRVPRTPVHATTLHWLCALSVEGESKLDPTNAEDEATKRLASMTVLMLDEGSMIDSPFWRCVRDQLSSVGATSAARTSDNHQPEDPFGRLHTIVALDVKQLPLATS